MQLEDIQGLGPKSKDKLAQAEIFSVEDLLLTVPKGYDDQKLAETPQDGPAYYQATVLKPAKIFSIRRGLKRLTTTVDVFGQSINIALFNQTHWFHQLTPGTVIVLYGTLDRSMTVQKLYLAPNFKEGLKPKYRLKDLSDARFSRWVSDGFNTLKIPEDLPQTIVEKFALESRHETIYFAHFPRDIADVERFFKRQKIAYLTHRELTLADSNQAASAAKHIARERLSSFLTQLPFSLTNGQQEALDDIVTDLENALPKRRLLQGDTGSGKTIVTFLAALFAIEAGYQVAFMAPTEILAVQHFHTFNHIFKGQVTSQLLTGSLDKAAMKEMQNAVHDGSIDIVFGTHVLFSASTHFQRLGLVVIDEQHRFGVTQREALIQKGVGADLISLSATPIPRTLALTLYQGMDVSTIKTLPEGRLSVQTEVVPVKSAKTLDYMIRLALEANQQIFIIAPRIDDDPQLLSVERIDAYYTDIFKDARIKTLHGQQSSFEKTETLKAFQAHSIDVLIATSVVEVGIDIKDAGLMLIYHAERFGYAQLHQLRGRLGRHDIPGVCYLLYKGNAAVKHRLEVLKTISDGFELSQIDLKTRGFGSLFGTDQTGFNRLQEWPYEDTLKLIETIQETLQETP